MKDAGKEEPRPRTLWTRKRDGEEVLVTKVEKGVVTFHTTLMLIEWDRPVEQFLRNYRFRGPKP